MEMDKELVGYIASLAKIHQTDEQCERMCGELGRIVDYMQVLNSLDTTGVEPMSHVFDIQNALRGDEVVPSFRREKLLSCAKSRCDISVIVPKTVE